MSIAFFKKHWFLVGLVLLVGGGLTVGLMIPGEVAEKLEKREGVGAIVASAPGWITRIVLFLMAFTLDSGKLRESLRFPLPVLWASLVNAAAIPLAGLGLMRIQGDPSFEVGLMIACSVPCTLAAVSVWTRKAGGNDAVSLLITLMTNTLCFLVAPFWLNLALAGGEAQLPMGQMMERLLYVVLIPTLLGQAARMIPAAGRVAVENKSRIGISAQGLILVLVFAAASLKAGPRLKAEGVALEDVAVVWACCLGLHLGAMAIGGAGARLMRFSREDRIAVLFGSSQKTLPIGVFLATSTEFGFGESYPLAVFPMLMFHATQLFVDTVIAGRIADDGVGDSSGDAGAEDTASAESGAPT